MAKFEQIKSREIPKSQELENLKKEIKATPWKKKIEKTKTGPDLKELWFDYIIAKDILNYNAGLNTNLETIVDTMNNGFQIDAANQIQLKPGTKQYEYTIISYGKVLTIDLITWNINGKSKNWDFLTINMIQKDQIIPQSVQNRTKSIKKLNKTEANKMYKFIYQLIYAASLTNRLENIQSETDNQDQSFQAEWNRIDFYKRSNINDDTAASSKTLKTHWPDTFESTEQMEDYVKFLNAIVWKDYEPVKNITGLNLKEGFNSIEAELAWLTTTEKKITLISKEMARAFSLGRAKSVKTANHTFTIFSSNKNSTIRPDVWGITYYHKKDKWNSPIKIADWAVTNKDQLMYETTYISLIVNYASSHPNTYKNTPLLWIDMMRKHAPHFLDFKQDELNKFLEKVAEDTTK